MNSNPRTITIVSNRLPVTVTDSGVEKSSGGLVAAMEGVDLGDQEVRWLGWPGKEVPEAEQAGLADTLAHEYGCTPVFLPAQLARDHYEGFSNSSLWPLLHSMTTYFQYRIEWWDAYQQVNQLFADQILASTKEGETVWVHDYQLMLLPRLLRQARPSLKIGFFLHTPFPSHDIFSCHPNREALVAGLLGADLIGFHTFGYLRHFRSTVLRLMGLDSNMTTVRHEGQTSVLGVHPIGIDAGRFEREMQTDAFKERCAASTAAYAGKRLILSVERLDYTKGVVQRLDAIELFLSRLTPEERDTVQFLFVSVPTRLGVDQYRELRETVEHRVGRINGAFASLHHSPIHFIHQSVGFTELSALYALADVALVTPLIDGMNLVAKEFVACQTDAPVCAQRETTGGRRGPGVLVLSEFAGVAQEFPNALIVNPYNTYEIAWAIEQALAMPLDERRRRMWPMRARVIEYDAAAWARDFLADLAKETAAKPAGNLGIADVHRRLSHAIKSGQRVALFLDYDGTLREVVRDPSAATPHPELRDLLARLAAVSNLDTTIISGRRAEDLIRFLGNQTPFGLVAEHGAEVRPPHSETWRQLDQGFDLGWKEQVRRVLELYQRSTPGSHIEDKRTGLVWHYRQADPEFGRWKANQLVDELSIVAANRPVAIRHGRKIVEAASSHISKSAAASSIIAVGDYNLILLAGDDTTDESMFALAANDPRIITIRIGDGDTTAQHWLPSPAALREFLNTALPSASRAGMVTAPTKAV